MNEQVKLAALLNIPVGKLSVGGKTLTFEFSMGELLEYVEDLRQAAFEAARKSLKKNPLTSVLEDYLGGKVSLSDGGQVQIEKSVKVTAKAPSGTGSKTDSSFVDKVATSASEDAEVTKSEDAEEVKSELSQTRSSKKEVLIGSVDWEALEEKRRSGNFGFSEYPSKTLMLEEAKRLGILNDVKALGNKKKVIFDLLIKTRADNSLQTVEPDEEATISDDGIKTVTKSVKESPKEEKSAPAPKKKSSFMKTGDAIKASMVEEFSDLDDLLGADSNSDKPKNGKVKAKKSLKEIADNAHDVNLDEVMGAAGDDPDIDVDELDSYFEG